MLARPFLLLLILSVALMPLAPSPQMHRAFSDPQILLDRVKSLEDRQAALEATVNEHIQQGRETPTDIAILKLKMDGLQEIISNSFAWLFRLIAMALSGVAAYFFKRYMARATPPQWAREQAETVAGKLEEHRVIVQQHETKLIDRIDQAIDVSNSVNEKILSLGLQTADGKPLDPTHPAC